ncbi:DUF397 domain-containing protein [Actinopolyspora halophila]|uniref:DUF397 domain-containing protein n=1 Tax=Actinopolyspora halophila TaxID=1850 RepID=UPI0003819D67|nr:DUF397 domain-containing protein [Actinopolyspora halophila]
MTTFPTQLWRTSSYTQEAGQCVEVAITAEAVGVRDTKNRAAGHLTVPAAAFAQFLNTVKTTNGWR